MHCARPCSLRLGAYSLKSNLLLPLPYNNLETKKRYLAQVISQLRHARICQSLRPLFLLPPALHGSPGNARRRTNTVIDGLNYSFDLVQHDQAQSCPRYAPL